MIKYDEDNFDEVIGDTGFLKEILKSAKESKYKNIVTHDDKILANLLSKPGIDLRLRNNDLATVDETTKKSMIKKIQRLLGIEPLINE